jgi:hypothetical protein
MNRHLPNAFRSDRICGLTALKVVISVNAHNGNRQNLFCSRTIDRQKSAAAMSEQKKTRNSKRQDAKSLRQKIQRPNLMLCKRDG